MATKTRHFPLRFYELFFFLIISLSSRDRQQRHSTETLVSRQIFVFSIFPNCILFFSTFRFLLYDILAVCLLFGNCFWLQQEQGGFCLHFKEVFFSQAGFLFVLICFDFFSRFFFQKSLDKSSSSSSASFQDKFQSGLILPVKIRFSRKIKRQDWLILKRVSSSSFWLLINFRGK